MRTINIQGGKYRYLKDRVRNTIKIYKSERGESFARVGNKEDIDTEYYYHSLFYKNNFLVPQLIDKGIYDNNYYYTEKSIGTIHYGQMFSEEYKKKLHVSDQLFFKFIKITNKYYHSQYETISEVELERFKDRVDIDKLAHKFPTLSNNVLIFWKSAKRCTVDNPAFVLSHGDFQAYNIFDNGIIDFEASLYAPLGYDAAKCMYGAFFFPKAGNYEEIRSYQFSKEQISTLSNEYSKICSSKNLANPLEYKEEFIIFNFIWATSNIDKYPKLEKWRIHHLNNLLDLYLAGNKSQIIDYLFSG